MKQLVIYVHGKGGSEKEADHYRPLFVGSTVIGFDYQSQDPWHAEREFSDFFDKVAKGYDSVVLVANSIGAFFAMSGLAEKKIAKAFFISPIVSMERLIVDMMNRPISRKRNSVAKKKSLPVLGRPYRGSTFAMFEPTRLNGASPPAFYMARGTT